MSMTRDEAMELARKVTAEMRDDPRNILLLAFLSIFPSRRMLDEGMSDEEIISVWQEAVGEMTNRWRRVKAQPSVN